MKHLKFLVFVFFLNIAFSVQAPIEEVLRVGIGTVPTAIGILVNTIMTKVDMVFSLREDPNFKEYSYQVQNSAIELQRFGNWLKNRASTKEVYVITAVTAVLFYINIRITWWITKKAYNSLAPFSEDNRKRIFRIAVVVVILKIAKDCL